MTYAELKRNVLHLGLLDSFDDEALENSFSDAATRAIREVSMLVPRIKRVNIAHYPLRPMVNPQSFTHRADDVSAQCAGAKAFCFYITGGAGTLTVRKGSSARTVNISGAVRTLVRRTAEELFGNSDGDIILTFSGGFYRISELSFFDIESDDLVPPMEGTTYEMKYIVQDFSRFANSPFEDGRSVTEDYYIAGSCITFSADVSDGDYTVLYEHLPEAVNPDDPDADLDVDRSLEMLVPHLCAYYMWMDDQPEKASQFYQRYAEQAAMLRNDTRRVSTNIKYRSTNGWD